MDNVIRVEDGKYVGGAAIKVVVQKTVTGSTLADLFTELAKLTDKELDNASIRITATGHGIFVVRRYSGYLFNCTSWGGSTITGYILDQPNNRLIARSYPYNGSATTDTTLTLTAFELNYFS